MSVAVPVVLRCSPTQRPLLTHFPPILRLLSITTPPSRHAKCDHELSANRSPATGAGNDVVCSLALALLPNEHSDLHGRAHART